VTKCVTLSKIKEGRGVTGVLLVSSYSRKVSQRGAYYDLVFRDKTGEVAGIYWSGDFEKRVKRVSSPLLIVVEEERVQTWQDKPQIVVTDFEIVRKKEVSISHFRYVGCNRKSEVKAFETYLGKFTDGSLGKGVDPTCETIVSAFVDSRFYDVFLRCPASARGPFSYEGGLLRHTNEVIRFGLAALSKRCGAFEKSVFLAGAMLHDVGKCDSFSTDGFTIDCSKEWELNGDVYLGVQAFKELCSGRDFDNEVVRLIGHHIVSHKGKPEWGAFVLPSTPTALVLSEADRMSFQSENVFGESNG